MTSANRPVLFQHGQNLYIAPGWVFSPERDQTVRFSTLNENHEHVALGAADDVWRVTFDKGGLIATLTKAIADDRTATALAYLITSEHAKAAHMFYLTFPICV